MLPMSGHPPSVMEEASAQRSRASVARNAGIVSLAVMASRVLGLVRDQLFAALFGAGLQYDAFLTAFRVPNLLRDLLAEGALSSAFVTTFTQTLQQKGKDEAIRLSNRVATLIVAFITRDFHSRLGIYSGDCPAARAGILRCAGESRAHH